MAVAAASIRRGAVVLIRLPRDKGRPASVARSDLLSELSYAAVLPITSDIAGRHQPQDRHRTVTGERIARGIAGDG
jgi:hypothetical protein